MCNEQMQHNPVHVHEPNVPLKHMQTTSRYLGVVCCQPVKQQGCGIGHEVVALLQQGLEFAKVRGIKAAAAAAAGAVSTSQRCYQLFDTLGCIVVHDLCWLCA